MRKALMKEIDNEALDVRLIYKTNFSNSSLRRNLRIDILWSYMEKNLVDIRNDLKSTYNL